MSSTTLRPNGGTSAALTRVGGTTQWGVLSDDSDSTNVYSTTQGNAGTYDLTTVSLPSGAITKSVRARIRHQIDTGTGDGFERPAGFVQLSTGEVLAEVYGGQETSATTSTGAYAPVTLTQAQVDALKVRVYHDINTSLSSDATIRWYEAYVDLVYVTQPSTTVTAVSPDPYTASSIVPIAWSNTLDSDGGGQTRYEIKVFTDAQYGAGGFDPDTSTPYYTTGEVVSANTTADVGPLENSDTYRAYVRVAQTVNGASHWSDWAYDEFTMNVTTADVDTVTAAATNASGLITVTVAWDSGSSGWEYVEVQRSIDGGTTWTDVRGATYVATVDSGATDFTVVDYEVPNGTAADYRARATRLSSGLQITGSWVETTSSTTWTSTDQWLKAPNDPTLNMTFCLADRQPFRRDRRVGVFRPLGSAAPVAVSDVRSKRYGAMVVAIENSTDAADLHDLLEGAPVILVQFPADMDIADKYVAVLGDEELFRSRLADLTWRDWSIEYVEVTAPADPDAGR